MDADAIVESGNALFNAGDLEGVVESGNALFNAGDLEGATARYREALQASPNFSRAHYNLGVVMQRLGRFPEAEEHYRLVDAASSHFALARSNLSILELLRQEFAEGWDNYEMRIASRGIAVKAIGLPRLETGNLSSVRRVAIWSEQGIGDQILFSTLLPEFERRGIEAMVETDRRLVDTYRRSLPKLDFATDLASSAGLAQCDAQCPLGSIARLFRRSPESFSVQKSKLLYPEDSRVAAIDAALPRGLRIGISWRSFQPAGREHLASSRSAPLDCFGRLCEAGATLVDLQYGDVAAERSAFDVRYPGQRIDPEGLDRFNDLEGVLAAIAACDLVITPSNITAHLAGASGKPTWLVYLAAKPPFHYWMPGPNGRSLWYPSVEILTDRSWISWAVAFDALAERLASRA